MSYIHYTIVGHFDPTTLSALDQRTIRSLDVEAAIRLLAEFPDHVAEQIEFRDGYLVCRWAPYVGVPSEAVHTYAYRLAELQQCIAAESPAWCIMYPPEAQRVQAEAWRRWSELNPPKRQEPREPLLSETPPPGPCPYCGQPLRTAIARQCRHCRMDWHDADNVHRRGEERQRKQTQE